MERGTKFKTCTRRFYTASRLNSVFFPPIRLFGSFIDRCTFLDYGSYNLLSSIFLSHFIGPGSSLAGNALSQIAPRPGIERDAD